jgi:uncharacterized protein YndB with AHSA1/START domain
MDFREGGTSLVCMRAPQEYGGQELYNTWTYRRIDLNRQIKFTNHFTDQDRRKLDPAQMGLPPGVPKEVPHVITFKELNPNRTEMTVTEHGYTSEQARDISKMGMEQCLDKLAVLVSRA